MSSSKPHMKRASFTLPPEVIDQLAYVSSQLGASKSSIVGEVLSEALGPLSELLRGLAGDGPADPSETLRRLRGASGEVIRERLDGLRDVMDSIDDPDAFELAPSDDRPAGCSCDYTTGERVASPKGCLVHGRGSAKG